MLSSHMMLTCYGRSRVITGHPKVLLEPKPRATTHRRLIVFSERQSAYSMYSTCTCINQEVITVEALCTKLDWLPTQVSSTIQANLTKLLLAFTYNIVAEINEAYSC